MRKIKFDENGYLMPTEPIEMDLASFEYNFVNAIENSTSRQLIFENYLTYIQNLRQTIKKGFSQWIDGSFVTNKKNPNDIDFVTFIEYQDFYDYQDVLESHFSKIAAIKLYKNLDAYLVCEYPPEHAAHKIYLSDCAYWADWFGRSRYLRTKLRFKKGFIQLKID